MRRSRHIRYREAGALLTAVIVAVMGVGGCKDSPEPGLPSQPAAASPEVTITDHEVRRAVVTELIEDRLAAAHRVDVGVDEGVVTLEGSVESILARDRATRVAEAIRGVRAVVNLVKVTPHLRPDRELRSDVLTALMRNPVTESREVKVAVKGGEVTLRGRVQSWPEKRLATQIVKGIKGVVEVENLIDVVYTTERPDLEIRRDVQAMLRDDLRVDEGLIEIAVEDGEVTLSGVVGSAAEKGRAEAVAWVNGVEDVDASALDVRWWVRDAILAKQTPLRDDDDAIARAVKAALFYDPRVGSTAVEVEVEHQTATLTGEVDSLAARRSAGATARNTRGVLRVTNALAVREPPGSSDLHLARRARQRLGWDPVLSRHGLDVAVAGRVAHLSGTVPSAHERELAETAVSRVIGIQAIANNIVINPPDELPSDRELERWVRDRLESSAQVDADDVDVSVEDRVVTLRGAVPTYQALYVAGERARDAGAWRVENELRVR